MRVSVCALDIYVIYRSAAAAADARFCDVLRCQFECRRYFHTLPILRAHEECQCTPNKKTSENFHAICAIYRVQILSCRFCRTVLRNHNVASDKKYLLI